MVSEGGADAIDAFRSWRIRADFNALARPVPVAFLGPGGGTLVAQGDAAGVIHLRAPAASAIVRTLNVDARPIVALAASPAGERIAALGSVMGLVVVDARTGERILGPVATGGEATAVAYSPDGTRLAEAHRDGLVIIRDAATLAPVREIPSDGRDALSVAYSPDGATLAVGKVRFDDFASSGSIQLLDARDGTACGCQEQNPGKGDERSESGLLPDGKEDRCDRHGRQEPSPSAHQIGGEFCAATSTCKWAMAYCQQ